MDKIKSLNAVYTGGGIWLFYGELNANSWFLADDYGCICICDANPDNLDDSLSAEWQEKHICFEVDDTNERADFLHELLYRLRNPRLLDDLGGITRIEIDHYSNSFFE